MATGRTAVVDYGLCNIDSMMRALQECGALKIEATRDPRILAEADRIVLSGVGTFEAAMRNLKELQLLEPILDAGASGNVPILGACLGMQLLASKGSERTDDGAKDIAGLGFVKGKVIRLIPKESADRIPHIGWNEICARNNSVLFDGEDKSDFYFVHSFHLDLDDPVNEAARCNYCGGFTAAIEVPGKPIFGTQFHPEKSQKSGFRVLKNFLAV